MNMITGVSLKAGVRTEQKFEIAGAAIRSGSFSVGVLYSLEQGCQQYWRRPLINAFPHKISQWRFKI
jgi:hypothetical protein